MSKKERFQFIKGANLWFADYSSNNSIILFRNNLKNNFKKVTRKDRVSNGGQSVRDVLTRKKKLSDTAITFG